MNQIRELALRGFWATYTLFLVRFNPTNEWKALILAFTIWRYGRKVHNTRQRREPSTSGCRLAIPSKYKLKWKLSETFTYVQDWTQQQILQFFQFFASATDLQILYEFYDFSLLVCEKSQLNDFFGYGCARFTIFYTSLSW